MSSAAAAAAATATAAGDQSTTTAARTLYRNLLRMARLAPKAEARRETTLKIREGFRANATEANQDKVAELLKDATSRLGFLRMVTPSRSLKSTAATTTEQTGSTTYVYNADGVVRKRDRAAHSNWSGSNMDPDSVSRHTASLSRAGFRNNADAKGIF